MDGDSNAGVTAVETLSFRNLADQRLELPAGLTVLYGPNGAGKTNILEAVFFALTGVSFRPGSDRDAVCFGERTARAELSLSGPGPRRLMASVDRAGERRHLADGGPVTGSRPLVSVFLPDRLALVKGPPAHRRAHLDRFFAALWPARGELRARFGRALAQRNALVSRIRAGLAGSEALEAWDAKLSAEAEPLIAARAQVAEALREPFGRIAAGLGLEDAELRYRPRFAGSAAELAGRLAALRAEDLGRAYTSFGPQLDDLDLRLGERSLRRFGSQGQQRAALLALLFAERAVLIDAGRPAPLMLLDDVMSELDADRRSLLVQTLEGDGQALITATEHEHVPGARPSARIAVASGRAAPGLAAAA